MPDLSPHDQKRAARLRKTAKHIATQSHLDKIMASFPVEHQERLLKEIKPQLNLKDKV